MAVVPASSRGGVQGITSSGGPITLTPGLSAGAAEVNVDAAAGAKALGDELFSVFDDLGVEVFGVDALGGIAFNMVTVPFTGRVGFTIDGGSQFFYIGPALANHRGISPSGAALNPIESGALPTVAPVSGTAFGCSTVRDVYLVVPFTGDATNNAATCKIEVSPDAVTFSTLNTVSIAAALNLTGALDLSVDIWVPASWRVKLTATHGTLGTGTYY